MHIARSNSTSADQTGPDAAEGDGTSAQRDRIPLRLRISRIFGDGLQTSHWSESKRVSKAKCVPPFETVRSEERRVGKECVRRCRSRRSQYHEKKKKEKR